MFYVDIDNKKFISKPPESNSVSLQRPPSGCSFPPSCPPSRSWGDLWRSQSLQHKQSLIKKPILTHTEKVQIYITFVHEDFTPVDITDNTFVMAVDDNFDHQDQLIAFSQNFTILDGINGIVSFQVDCSSVKFQKTLQQHVPASQILMQIVRYLPGSSNGTAILQDRGIRLTPRVYAWQGAPDPASPDYYTKAQVDALLQKYTPVASDSSTGKIINGTGVPAQYLGTPGDLYIDTESHGIWLKGLTQWTFFGYIEDNEKTVYYDIIED